MKLLEFKHEATIPELAEALGMDRSSIQKGITGLMKKRLASRRQVNLEKGGYFFYYSTPHKKYIKNAMINIINKWHDAVISEIKKW